MRTLTFAALASTAIFSLPAHAISVSPTDTALGLANTLFLNLAGLQVVDASLSGEFGQAGTFTNGSGTYGLPNSGIVLSSGNVSDYADGPDTSGGFTTSYGGAATTEQQSLLGPITGQPSHFDVVQLDISFNVGADIDQVSFFGTFGSEEFPEFVNSSFNDGFGLFVNDQNVAGVATSGGGANLPVNIDHPDMTAIAGTELDGVLAPNGNPVLRFDVPVIAGQVNDFTIILADAGDSALDTTVYLSSFIAQGNTGDTGGPPPSGDGTTEFNPILPSNPPDPQTGEFVIELPVLDPEDVVWIDPPVAVGYVYDAGSLEFDVITAPSLATVADLDGYFITVDGVTEALAPGATLDFLSVFGDTPSSFTLSGINENLMLDPENPLAFPLAVSFTTEVVDGQVSMTPITVDVDTPDTPVIPLPASGVLLGCGIAAVGALKRRRRAAA